VRLSSVFVFVDVGVSGVVLTILCCRQTLDSARFYMALDMFTQFFRSGGWMALGGKQAPELDSFLVGTLINYLCRNPFHLSARNSYDGRI
jgi:hypothetical protein